ncbi:MAG: ABC transporter ATP-binding protein [Anaerolineae bacterium]|nr:ABC transporter ATP-binding protein [Anaerolineae bacterium]
MMGGRRGLLGAEVSKPRSAGATLKRFWGYFKHYWFALLVTIVLVVISTWTQVRTPELIGQAVDCYLTPAASQAFAGASAMVAGSQDGAAEGESGCWYDPAVPADAGPEELVWRLGGLVALVAGLYILGALVSGAQFYTMAWAGQRALTQMRVDLFRHLLRLNLSFYNKEEVGGLMSRITNDIDTIQQMLGFGLVNVTRSVLLLVWVVATMLSLNVPYTLVSMIVVPFMVIVTVYFAGQARKAYRRVRQEIGEVNADLQESIAGVREVQAFSREDENIAEFRASNAANRDANIRAASYTSALGPILEALSYISTAIVVGVGGWALLSGDGKLLGSTISLGLIITFMSYVQNFNQPIQQISMLWANIQSAIAGGERIFDLMDEEPEIADEPGAVEMPFIEGRVVFKDVFAHYKEDEPVLCNINLAAEPGQTVAIVGPTGAGKTTLVNLIPRFYDVQSGAIAIDGRDVRRVTRASLRRQIGIVLQDTFLFSESVMENIRYGKPGATDEEVIEAARLAHADDFISRLPDGYNTVLGERGAGLSQGQRQLVAIARAILGDARILILDEATSSVDTRTERLIQSALDRLMKGRTTFVIAHRLSTIRNADQVLVLNEGDIVERGTHESLLAARGFYYDLYMSQFRHEATIKQDGRTAALQSQAAG